MIVLYLFVFVGSFAVCGPIIFNQIESLDADSISRDSRYNTLEPSISSILEARDGERCTSSVGYSVPWGTTRSPRSI